MILLCGMYGMHIQGTGVYTIYYLNNKKCEDGYYGYDATTLWVTWISVDILLRVRVAIAAIAFVEGVLYGVE